MNTRELAEELYKLQTKRDNKTYAPFDQINNYTQTTYLMMANLSQKCDCDEDNFSEEGVCSECGGYK